MVLGEVAVMVKHFDIEGSLWCCDTVFNWAATDADGKVFLYQHKPFIREAKSYWTSGHCSSFDLQLPIIACDKENWKSSLVEMTY